MAYTKNKEIVSRIVHKHDTAANWENAKNFIPMKGEIIVYDIDTTHEHERFKIGDGKTLVNDLPFQVDISDFEDYKVKQSKVVDPSASGEALAFIDTIMQDEMGVITVTKKNVGKVANAETADKLTYLGVHLTGDVTGGITVANTDSVTIETELGTTNVTPGAYGPVDEDKTLTHDSSFTVPNFTVDQHGRITAADNVTYKLPIDENTQYSLDAANSSDNKGVDITLSNNDNEEDDTVTIVGKNLTSVSMSDGKVTIDTKLNNTGVTAGAYGAIGDNATLSHGDSFIIPNFQVTSEGRLTTAGHVTYTLPNDSDYDTTYDLSLVNENNDITLKLSGSNNTTDTIKIIGEGLTSVSKRDGDLVISAELPNVSVTPGAYGPTSEDRNLTHNGTFMVPRFQVDEKGRLTQAGHVTYTLPADKNENTTYDLSSASLTDGTGAKITLTPSTGTADEVKLVEGANVSIVRENDGDIVISSSDQYTGTITSITAGTGLTGGTITSSGTIAHATVSRTDGTNAQVSPAYGATFTVVDEITTSTTGHVTGVKTKNVKLPNATDLSNYYTKTEIDDYVLITVDDIDEICGMNIQVASLNGEVRF